MIIDARQGDRGLLEDLAAGVVIRRARWANLETGEFEARTSDGRLYGGRTRLRWTPIRTPCGGPPGPIPHATAPTAGVYVFTNRPCEHYGCVRRAEWKVADEAPLSPETDAGVSYERAQTIGVRYYCSWHYQPPRLLIEGDVAKVYDEVKARPS